MQLSVEKLTCKSRFFNAGDAHGFIFFTAIPLQYRQLWLV
jgi:hypothetical protein